MVRRALDWAFRDRATGKIVIAQLPNLPLAIFFVAVAIQRVAHPDRAVGTVVRATATVALLWWAGDEVLRGVNPFRRTLGAVVAGAVVLELILG